MNDATPGMQPVLEGGNFFEGLGWHEGHWYLSDSYGQRVLKITPDGKVEELVKFHREPLGLGHMPDGSLLIVSIEEGAVYRRHPDGSVKLHADISALTGGVANDMVTDATGRAYVTCPGFDVFTGEQPKAAPLIVIEPDGSASIAAEDLLYPNGAVLTPDGGTLIVAETFGAQLRGYDVAADGSLSNDRVWAKLAPTPSWDSFEEMMKVGFAVDGLSTTDAEGCVWVADAFNNRAARVGPDSEIRDEIRSPNGGIFDVALGGEDGRTLMCATAPEYMNTIASVNKDSILYQLEVEVPLAD